MKFQIGDIKQDNLYRRETREGRIKLQVKNNWYIIGFSKSILYDDQFGDYDNEIKFDLPDKLYPFKNEIEEFLTNYFENEGAK